MIHRTPPADRISSAGAREFQRGPASSFEGLLRFGAIRHHAFLAALAEHAKHLPSAVDIAKIEADKLAHAQAGSIEKFENRAVALQDELLVEMRPRGSPAAGLLLSRRGHRSLFCRGRH